ncbi:phage tail assembly chaperone family protein, TAC [Moraxella canis]|uniref:Phage tail protein n=1 Tax=Moraxella canis TaxID=90239 RepID=A0A1S9ZKD6_9GAMM|nr:phage tail assembly chaperone family protein, TAC [Moraxella canis]OOR83914.1 hypothetical protein B0180_05590 [Moraxella canis]
MGMNKKELLAALGNLGAPAAYELEGVGTVYIKKLTIAEQSKLSDESIDSIKTSLKMVAFSVCDENGKRIFGETDIGELGKMHADTMTELVGMINEVNGFDKKIEELKKD